MPTPVRADRLRVAVVGAGYVAGHHLAALSKLDFVDLVGICDTNLEAARAMAGRYRIPLAASTLAELAAAQPRAVHVLTPPASHARIAMEALGMGCHVLVEKPMADTVADCEMMIAAARAHGCILGVNHSDLFDPMVEKAIDAAANGRIGEVLSVDIVRNSDYPPYAGGPLPAQVTQGSYPFRDLGVHGLYTIEAFLGPVTALRVDRASRGADPNLRFDEWQAHATTARGCGRLLLSWNARPMENRLVVRGTRGIIEVDRFLQTCSVRTVLPGPKFVGIVAGALATAAGNLARIPWNVLRFATGLLQPSPGIRRGAREFAQAARDGEAPPFSGEDALRIARLLEPACDEADRARREELEGRLAPLPSADVLVTGAAGFLGRALVAALRARGKRVRVLVRRTPGPGWADDPQVDVVLGDLGDPRIVDHAVAGIATVYHVGAAMRGGPRDFEAGTTWGTRNVVESCLRHSVPRLAYVSSLSVLDHAGRRPGEVVDETYRLEPRPQARGSYTRTKLDAEQVVAAAVRDRGLPAVILRPGQIFGPGAEGVTPNGTLSLAGRWIAVGPRGQTLPLVYLDDVVDALLLAAEVPAAVGQVIHVVDPQSVRQDEYLTYCAQRPGSAPRLVRIPAGAFAALGYAVELLGRALGRELPLSRYRVRSLRPLANVDASAARDLLGWTPRVGVVRGLETTFGSKG